MEEPIWCPDCEEYVEFNPNDDTGEVTCPKCGLVIGILLSKLGSL